MAAKVKYEPTAAEKAAVAEAEAAEYQAFLRRLEADHDAKAAALLDPGVVAARAYREELEQRVSLQMKPSSTRGTRRT